MNRNPWLAAFPPVAPEGTRLHFCLRQKLRLRRPLRRRARRPRRLATDFSRPFLFCAKEKGAHSVRPLFFGTPEGTRTPNPQNRKARKSPKYRGFRNFYGQIERKIKPITTGSCPGKRICSEFVRKSRAGLAPHNYVSCL